MSSKKNQLNIRFLLSIGIMLFTILGIFIFMQHAESKKEGEAKLINISGRQRMLSQRITQLSLRLIAKNDNSNENSKLQKQLTDCINEWIYVQNKIQYSNITSALFVNNTPEITALYHQIRPAFDSIVLTAKQVAIGKQISTFQLKKNILEKQDIFLEGMDLIVSKYQDEIEYYQVHLFYVAIWLLSLLILLIVFIAVFLIRPTIHQVESFIEEINQQNIRLTITNKELELIRKKEKATNELFNNISVFVPGMLFELHLMTDGNIKFPYVSDGVKDLFDITPKETSDNHTLLLNRIYPEDIVFLNELLVDSVENLSAWKGDFRIMHPSRGLMWLRGEATPEKRSDAVVFYGYLLDITERKNEKNELTKTKQLLEKTSSIAKVGAWEIDLVSGYRYWSKVTKEILEVPEDAVPDPKTNWNFFKEGVHRDTIAKALGEAMEKGVPFDVEVQIITAKGNEKWVRTEGLAEFENDRPIKLFGIFQDISVQKKLQEALAQSEAQFRNAFEYAAIGMALIDLDGGWIEVNQSLCDITGYSQEELKQLKVHDLVPPEELKTHFKYKFELLEGRKSSRQRERKYKHKNGSIVWVWSAISLLRDAENKPVHFIAQVENITNRKIAEQKLQKERIFLNTLIDNIPVNVYTKDLLSRKTLVNRSEVEFYGVPDQSALLGKDDFSFFPVPIAADNIQEDSLVIDTGVPILNKEKNVILKNGRSKWVLSSKIPLYDEDKNVIGILGISYDISERKYAEDLVKLSEEKFRSLFEMIPVGIVLFDLKTRQFIDSNNAYLDIVGRVKKEALYDVDYWDVTPVEYQNLENEMFDQLIIYGRTQAYEKELMDTKGNHIPVLVKRIKLKNNVGRDIVLSVVENITLRKQQEQQISRATIVAQENERYEIGRELHDNINQIMVSIILSLDMIRGELTEKNQHWLDYSRKHLKEAVGEIRNLSHRLAPVFTETNSFRAAFNSLLKNINLENRFKIDLSIVDLEDTDLANEVQLNLYRILQEQINNIIKYADATEIYIALEKIGKEVVMCIKDNGKGFDTEKAVRGIGLHNIQKRTELLSGTFSLRSSVGEGCEIIVRIPLGAGKG